MKKGGKVENMRYSRDLCEDRINSRQSKGKWSRNEGQSSQSALPEKQKAEYSEGEFKKNYVKQNKPRTNKSQTSDVFKIRKNDIKY